MLQSSLVAERGDEGIIERASHVERSGGGLPLLKSSENWCQIQGTCSFSVNILAGVQLTDDDTLKASYIYIRVYSTERDIRRCLGGVSDWSC